MHHVSLESRLGVDAITVEKVGTSTNFLDIGTQVIKLKGPVICLGNTSLSLIIISFKVT